MKTHNLIARHFQLYSVIGGIFLLKWGQFLYFVYPEWYVNPPSLKLGTYELLWTDCRQIYGGIGLGVGFLCLITLFAFGNVSRCAQPHCIVSTDYRNYRGRTSGRGSASSCGRSSLSYVLSARLL
jgi:hypothetical protein